MATFQIKNMQMSDVEFAIDLAKKEGWNPGLEDANCFFHTDPNGFFIGLLDNKPIKIN